MNIHNGHRARLKQRFLEQGLDGFADHEVLELLLFYAIPRADVNPLAHQLLAHFGSIDRVLEASVEELCQVKGIGESTALLLHLVPQVERRYAISRNRRGEKIRNSAQASVYLAPYFRYAREELIYLLCLDSSQQVICCLRLAQGSSDCANFSIRQVAEAALSRKASGVILAHNHPSGIALPSGADLITTKQLKGVLEAVGIRLLDHLVLGNGDFVSLSQSEGEPQEDALHISAPL